MRAEEGVRTILHTRNTHHLPHDVRLGCRRRPDAVHHGLWHTVSGRGGRGTLLLSLLLMLLDVSSHGHHTKMKGRGAGHGKGHAQEGEAGRHDSDGWLCWLCVKIDMVD